MVPLTKVFTDHRTSWTAQLLFRWSAAGLDISAEAGEPNRLLLEGQPVSRLRVSLTGPAAGAFWEMLLAGQQVRCVEGVTIDYHVGEQRLVLLLEASDTTSVLLDDRPALRAEIQLGGPGATAIWMCMFQRFPLAAGEFFAD